MTMTYSLTRPAQPRGLTLPAPLRLVVEWYRRHRILSQYERMSDEMLRDIGLTRGDLDAALALPLTEGAGEALARAAADEAAKW